MNELSSNDIKSIKLRSTKTSSVVFRNSLISAGITLICFLLLCIISDKYPFGSKSVLASDLEAQYAPFLFLLKNNFANAKSINELFYSFSLGGGKNMMATLGYYLLSPINILVAFFASYHVSEFILLLIAIKIVLSAFNMSLFITDKQSEKNSYVGALFGIIYAFSSYSLYFMFQIMWLDAYMILPLLLYFIDKYLDKNKKTGVIVTLLYLFISNYYTAYMAGIFSFFYLIVRMYVRGDLKNAKSAAIKILKFILMAVFCGMSIAVILIPVGLDTLRNSDPTVFPASKDIVKFSIVDFIDQMFGGTSGEFGDIMIANPPFIFLSIFVTLSIVITFISKVFDKKTKVLYGVLLSLIYFSLSIDVIDRAWQVFDAPNWFYHRESFVFLPFFLFIALRVYEKRKEILNIEILKSAGIVLALLFISHSFGAIGKNEQLFVFYIFYIVIISGVLMLFKKEKWPDQLKNMSSILPALLALLLVCEVAFFQVFFSVGAAAFSVSIGDSEEYAKLMIARINLLQNVESTPDRFRAEYERSNLGEYAGDSMYCDYNGITLFNSNSNKAYQRFLKQFGYICNYNYFFVRYSCVSEDVDSLLSIGTVISNRDYQGANNSGMVDYNGGINRYINEEVLPIAFSVDSNAVNFDFYKLEKDIDAKNYFVFRNELFNSLFPDAFSEDYYELIDNADSMEVVNASSINLNDYIYQDESEDVELSDTTTTSFDYDTLGLEDNVTNESAITLYKTNSNMPIVINYEFEVTSSDEMYLNISAPNKLCDFKVYVDGKVLAEVDSPNTYYSTVFRLGSFEEGHDLQVSIISNSDSFTYQSINFAYLNHEVFAEEFNAITNNVTVSEVSDGHVVMTSNLLENEIVLTSIPYEDGWELLVDGKKCDIVPYADALIAINPGAGSHTIELNFTPPGLKIGAIVSVIGIVGLIGFCIMDKKKSSATKA